MLRIIVRTNCAWWCAARFWAEHVHLHANLALLDDAVATHAQVFDFDPCWNAQGMLRIRAAADADARTRQALTAAAATTAASAVLAAKKASKATASAAGRQPVSDSANADDRSVTGSPGPLARRASRQEESARHR